MAGVVWCVIMNVMNNNTPGEHETIHAGVQFQEVTQMVSRTAGAGIARLLMANSGGLIHSETQAGYVLMAFVVAALAISFFLFSKPSPGQLTDTEKTFLEHGGSTQAYDNTLFAP